MRYLLSFSSALTLALLLAAPSVQAAPEKPAVESEALAPEPEETAPAPETAAPEEPAPTHSRILPVKIKPVQEGADGVSKAAPDIQPQGETDIDADALALYTTQASGSLGPDLWQNVSRNEVIKGLRALPATTHSKAQRDLALRVLLTKAAVAAGNEDSAGDVFSARLSKLIELGAYREAMSLYEKLEVPAGVDEAALAGMKAFVGNGQLALACLEQKALDPNLKSEDPFWSHLDKFCKLFISADSPDVADDTQSVMRAALAYAEAEKIVSPAQFEDLNSRSLIELLVLSQSGILDRGKWNVSSASKLSPGVIAFLLAQEPKRIEQKLSLFVVATRAGLRTADELSAAYQDAAGSTASHGDWAPFLNSLTKFRNAESNDEKLKQLKSLLAASATLDPAAYAPVAAQIAALKPAAPLTAADACVVLDILIFADAALPADWVNFAYGTSYESDSGESSLVALHLTPPEPAPESDEKPAKPVKKAKLPLTPQLAYALILQAYLGIPEPKTDEDKSSYDNFLSLTGKNNYVMPSHELTESLKKAAQAGSLGKILLYSLQALDGQKVDRVHPELLSRVLKALKTAGLSEETVSLAHEALSGLTETKEN